MTAKELIEELKKEDVNLRVLKEDENGEQWDVNIVTIDLDKNYGGNCIILS